MRLLFLSLLFTAAYLTAQCDQGAELDRLALQAYLTNDAGQWSAIITHAEALPQSDENDLQLAKLLFGATGTALSKEDEETAEDYIDRMEAPLDRLLKKNKKHPAANGFYSGYLGMLIAQSPMKGILYGSKAGRMASQATTYGPNEPLAHYFHGSNLYYTPTTWGGDPEAAVVALQKAVDAYPPTADGCDWFYLQAHALLGQAQRKIGDKEGARSTYLAALKLQPDFQWVKNVLLPALDKAR